MIHRLEVLYSIGCQLRSLGPTAGTPGSAVSTPNGDGRDHVAGRKDHQHASSATARGAGIDSSTVQSWLRPPAPGNVTPIRSAVDLDVAALLDRLPPAGPTPVDDPIRSLDALMLTIDSAGLEPAQ